MTLVLDSYTLEIVLDAFSLTLTTSVRGEMTLSSSTVSLELRPLV